MTKNKAKKMWSDKDLKSVLKSGGVAVMPTDTIYGVVGQALREETVKRIFKIKKRAAKKPCIVLIGERNELKKFGINLTRAEEKEIKKLWSKPASIVLDCTHKKFSYLHRGTKTLAFRLPASKKFRDFLKSTGPLVAPSANPEGLPPARSIREARKYFGSNIDFYADGGTRRGKPSKIVRLYKNGSRTIIRE